MRAADGALIFDRNLRSIVGPIFLGFLLLDLWSAFALRGLFADGARYFLGVIEHGAPFLLEPARRTVQFLQQLPTVLALDFDLLNLRGLIVLFGATTHGLPLLLLGLCWLVLPPDRKALFAFPLLHFLAGTQAAGLVAIAEGPVAAGYFWFLLLLISFRTDGIRGQLGALFLALPALYLHEGMVLLAPVLAAAASLRARGQRPLLWLLVGWFLVVAILQAGFILHPRSVAMWQAFIQSMLLLKFVVEPWTAAWTVNVPAILGLLAILGLPILVVPERSQRRSWFLVAAYATLCMVLVAAAMLEEFMFSPAGQFHARSGGLLLSLPLGLLFLVALRRPALHRLWERPPVIGVIVALAIGQLGCQAIATWYWSEFVTSFESVLANRRGLVAWREALASLPVENAKTLRRMDWRWTNPTLSLLLAPGGKVATVIDVSEPGWEPFDPADPNELPQSPLIDTASYRAALAR
jgi:hypothetical protein